MGGLPMGLIDDLVADRRAELFAGTGAGHGLDVPRRQRRRGRGRHGGQRGHGGHRAPVRLAGRMLVAAGVRLAGADALRGA